MFMYSGNQFIIGCLYLVLGVEAYNYFNFWPEDKETYSEPSYGAERPGFYPPQDAFYQIQEEPVYDYSRPSPVEPVTPVRIETAHIVDKTYGEPSYGAERPGFYPPQDALYQIQEEPVYDYSRPSPVEPVTPVRIETAHIVDKVEHHLHVPHAHSLELRKLKFMSTTETVTLTARALSRATVVITPTVYQTATKVVQTRTVVSRNIIHDTYSTVTETILDVNTITKPQIVYRTVSTPVVMYLTVEVETTEIVWQPYTLTTTSKQLITIWTTRTVDLESERNVLIPVVEVKTVTTTVPFHTTKTDWITRTDTTTLCKDW